ncbi:MAG: hypothetical protein EAZ91_08975 [Cytophagales bacterium]|nr:MAG: hypothetical protein EAZ91_08975 [Cytophagales bacterium]
MNKIYVLLMLLVVAALNACQRADLVPTDTSPSEYKDVPTVVVQAVQNAYPAAVNLKFTEVDKGNIWSADFMNAALAHQATVSKKGEILEAYSVADAARAAAATLPAVIEAFIQKNYAGYKLIGWGEGQHNGQKAYKVALRKEREDVTLIFDANGVLLFTYKATVPVATTITAPRTIPISKVEELTSPIAAYLKTNGMTFGKGLAVVDKDGKKTYLIVATKGSTVFELTFDNDGKLLKSSSYTPPPAPVALKSVSELPTAAITYMAGYTFVSGTVITGTDGQKTYLVNAKKEGKQFTFAFDNAGKLIRSAEIKPLPKVESKSLTDKDLPAVITSYLNANYKGWSLTKGAVTIIDGVASNYLLVIKVGADSFTVSFDGAGKFIGARKNG